MSENTEIKKYIKKIQDDSDKRLDKKLKQHMERYVGVVVEEFQSRVSIIAEQLTDVQDTLKVHTEILDSHTATLDSHTKILDSHTATLDSHTATLGSHTEMIGSLMVNMDIVKDDIKIIKNDLKQKVDRSEFELLVKRVSFVEKNILK